MRSSQQSIGTGISDLFFNHEHPSYDNVTDIQEQPLDGQSPDEVRAELVKDAGEFLLAFKLAVEEVCITPLDAPDEVFPSAEELADDFLARL